MAGNFKPNDAGLRAILNGPEVRRVLAEVADKGKEFAESISPYDPAGDENEDNEHYRNSFEIRDETIESMGRHPGPRAAARLQNTAPYAAAVEFGYEGRSGEPGKSAHRVLGRTLEFLEGSS